MFINRETISSFFKSFKSNNFNDGNMGIVFTLWIIFILKLCIDIMFYMENLFVSNLYAITDYIIKIILILGLGIFNYNKSRNIVNRVKKYRDIHQKQEFFYDYIGTAIVIVIITFIKIILINSLNSIYIYRDWQYAIRLEFIFILIIYVAEKVLFFVYRWLSIRKNKNTSMAIILSVFAALFTCVNAIIHISSDIINFLILFILISISLIFASKIYSWVITITTKKKIGLLIFALIAILSLGVDIVTIISQYIEPHKLSNALKPIYNVIYITFVVYSNFVFIPSMLAFAANFGSELIANNIDVNEYFSFVAMILLALGVLFELPMISFVLSKFEIVSSKLLSKYRRHAYVVILILAAILTPTPDPVSQIIFAAPIVVLYEISVLVAKIARKKNN